MIAQTYDNWEYILVNNCSKDRTAEIAKHYAACDNRIRIHHNRDFVGVIQNHNIAFRQMSPASRYCKVVQADDWLFPDCLRQMIALAEGHPTVGIVGSYALYDTRVECDGLPYPSTVVPGPAICRLNLLRALYVFLSPTLLLIRADLIRSRENYYNESHLHADVEACYEDLQHIDFGFVHQVLSYVRRHDESVTSSVAQRLNTIALSNLALLLQYGRVYLSRAEYEACLRRQINDYYKSLAKSLYLSPEKKQIWRHHARALKDLDCSLSTGRLMKAFLIAGLARWVLA